MGENTAPQIQLDQLVSTINGYNKSVDKQLISRAFFFAYKAHGSQRRANGDPYFSHVFEVAKILTGFSLDAVYSLRCKIV
jgi:(p)ppGpp synthase/HD superfamily hydrolase